MSDKNIQELSTARDGFLSEHKETSKYVARLALSSKKSSLTFKMKLAKLYKLIFGIK